MKRDATAVWKLPRRPARPGRLSLQYLRRAPRRRLAATGALLAMIALAVAVAG